MTKTTVDWLRFRTQGDPGEALQAVRALYGTLGQDLHYGEHQRGALGFQRAMPLLLADMVVGRVDYGGESQRGWLRVDLPGRGCSFVQDWDAIEACEALPSAEPSRLDLALTTWQGEVSHEVVAAAHAAGKFTTAGRPPNLQEITNSDAHRGRTLYVGARKESPKFLRCYEKGYELASKMPGCGTVTHIDGFPVEDIYRVELELKNKGMPIPWEAIERRDQYFAGAYPFCAEILPGVEADILQRRPEKGPQRDLHAALAQVRHQFGKTLFTALTAYHGDIGAVWEKVCGQEHNRHLLEAGVLLVDHD